MLIYSIEDDEDIAIIINKTLTKHGFEVKTFYDGKSFYESFKTEKPNIILLDMMLPDMNGLDILRDIRSNNSNDSIHIIIISAKHLISDKVEGLDLGADDYIEKPFDLLELMARVDAQVRRLKGKNIINYKGIVIDVNKRECKHNDEIVDLTVKEFDILYLLMKNAPNVLTREEIFNKIWNTNQILESRALDMHIKTLRNKLNDDGTIIKTIYGIGYKFNNVWKSV